MSPQVGQVSNSMIKKYNLKEKPLHSIVPPTVNKVPTPQGSQRLLIVSKYEIQTGGQSASSFPSPECQTYHSSSPQARKDFNYTQVSCGGREYRLLNATDKPDRFIELVKDGVSPPMPAASPYTHSSGYSPITEGLSLGRHQSPSFR